jgi:hypothetical protein
MKDLQAKLTHVDQEVSAQLRFLTGLRGRLRKATKELASGKPPIRTLRQLSTALRETPAVGDGASIANLASEVERQIATLTQEQERTVITELRSAAEKAGVPLGRSGDNFTLGPVLLKLIPAKEAAALEFSKLEVASLPLDAGAIVDAALELRGGLLRPPADGELPGLAQALEEAIRVAVVRKKGQSLVGQLRAELPSVYKEMCWIRSAARKGHETAETYPLARFVVEVKTLISSQFNVDRSRRLKLETSVIENAGNARKSIFLPNNLDQGWGEGTYFQAIVLLANP